MSFYLFCQEMLERYKDDARIYSVSGMNFGFTSDNGADYYFTHYNNTWGWATWRRVWDKYDFGVSSFPDDGCEEVFLDIMLEPAFVRYWYNHFRRAYEKSDLSAWDYQFTYLSFINQGLHIYPQKNLVSYRGFDENATHTVSVPKGHRLNYSTKETKDLSFPLINPLAIQADFRIDYLIMREIFNVSTGDLKACKKLPEGLVKEIKQFQEIIIYGAGAVCRDVIWLLGRENIDRFKIAVTKKEGNEKQYVMGNEVRELSDYRELADGAIVLIAVTKKYEEPMIDNLKKLGFERYVGVSE
ncbi:MAG: hypothetical protein K6E62_08835 [Lachnospiraceae bacterium]|nr:hypothetical protein [Lachnospiraceae bacterium]